MKSCVEVILSVDLALGYVPDVTTQGEHRSKALGYVPDITTQGEHKEQSKKHEK